MAMNRFRYSFPMDTRNFSLRVIFISFALSISLIPLANSAQVPCTEPNLVQELNSSVRVCLKTSDGFVWQATNIDIPELELDEFEPAYDGFALQILNFDENFKYIGSSSSAKVVIDESGRIEVTNILSALGDIEIRTYSGYFYKTTKYSGSAFKLTSLPQPMLGAVSETDLYAEAEILNYDPSLSYEVSASDGDAAIDVEGFVVLMNYSEPLSSLVKVTVQSEGARNSSTYVNFGKSVSLPTPEVSAPLNRAVSSFELQIYNYVPGVKYLITSSAGKVSLSNTGLIVIYNLLPGEFSQVDVAALLGGSVSESVTVKGSASVIFQKANKLLLDSIAKDPNKYSGSGVTLYAQLMSSPVKGKKNLFKVTFASTKSKPARGLTGKSGYIQISTSLEERILLRDFVEIAAVVRGSSRQYPGLSSGNLPVFEVLRIERY